MYSSEDFERLFIRYKGEAYPRGESIQAFCHRNKVPLDWKDVVLILENPIVKTIKIK